MTADLTPAQAARLEAIEAAPYAEEAAVERVARAIYAEANPPENPWCESWDEVGDFAQNRYRRLAVAAIDVMRGAADDGAVGRVLALCDRQDEAAHSLGAGFPSQLDVAQIRAAIGAPATAEVDDRG